MKYITLAGTLLLSTMILGCSNHHYTKHRNYHTPSLALIGNWYAIGGREFVNSMEVSVRKKEQFFQNGTLLSSKWFKLRAPNGANLGEFYITKLFSYKADNRHIVAKFKRCNVGVVKPLKVAYKEYSRLKRQCENSLARQGKVSIKSYRFINRNYLKIGRVIYQRVSR